MVSRDRPEMELLFCADDFLHWIFSPDCRVILLKHWSVLWSDPSYNVISVPALITFKCSHIERDRLVHSESRSTLHIHVPDKSFRNHSSTHVTYMVKCPCSLVYVVKSLTHLHIWTQNMDYAIALHNAQAKPWLCILIKAVGNRKNLTLFWSWWSWMYNENWKYVEYCRWGSLCEAKKVSYSGLLEY